MWNNTEGTKKGVDAIVEYFIAGIAFVQIILPLLDSIVGVLVTGLEVIKSNLSKKIVAANCEIRKMQSPEESVTRVIGFATSQDYGEEEDYD